MKRLRLGILFGMCLGLSWAWPHIAIASDDSAPQGGDKGYDKAFAAARKKIGPISPAQFSSRFGNVSYVKKFSWDPTTAAYWERFAVDTSKKGARVPVHGKEAQRLREYARSTGRLLPANEPVTIPAFGRFNFSLTPGELTAFKKNGFVVSERLGTYSCLEMYYRLYKRDLPVFVTSDSVLHAWHRSYDAILVEVEMQMLIPALDKILSKMSEAIPKLAAEYGKDTGRDSLQDADFFLTVARSLLAKQQIRSPLGQDQKVKDTLAACYAEQLQKFPLFGKMRDVDFSQFKPRGHYEKKAELRRYFRAMMWCGRIDMRIAGDPDQTSPRQLASALLLHELLQRSGQFQLWQQFDQIVQTFVGKSDYMTFAQMSAVLDAAKVNVATAVKNPGTLRDLQKRIGTGKFGKQQIRGHVFVVDPSNPDTYILPHTFAFLGQKFVIDSWVTSKIVYDEIKWQGSKVQRRLPSCLDVSFAAFGNDHVVPLLTKRMTTPGRRFRDNLNYQHNLAAVREVINTKPATMWRENLYTGWLGALRELSKPTTDKKYPEAMRTQAWAMKTTNTQLASWTQLRHDTILYAKQSYTAVPGCYYPAGYVEPVPPFWAHMEQMTRRAAKLIEQTPYSQEAQKKRHAKFFSSFANTMARLRAIAEKELDQKPLTKQETKFLEDIITIKHVRIGSGTALAYSGWYPNLFYWGANDAMKWDALVADVHTNPPAPTVGDPGCVLHQGVGNVDLLMIAVDNGKERMVFAGPTLSHYEFEMPGVRRKSDSEWQMDLRARRIPPRPEWTRGYLIPGEKK